MIIFEIQMLNFESRFKNLSKIIDSKIITIYPAKNNIFFLQEWLWDYIRKLAWMPQFRLQKLGVEPKVPLLLGGSWRLC